MSLGRRDKVVEKGDYVLATKYSDGDPGDQYAVGFYDGILPKIGGDRYLVVDSQGRQFRGNGFRRVEPITPAEGRWLIAHFHEFEFFRTEEDENGDSKVVGKSVWDWLAQCRSTAEDSHGKAEDAE